MSRKDPLEFYAEVITEDFIDGILSAEGVVERDGLFKSAVVIWLMLCQRLKGNQSLSAAVEELRAGSGNPLLARA